MPALYTHYQFGQDVLNNLNNTIQKDISHNISYYNIFNQGWDNLYYYVRKLKYYKHLGLKAHKKDVNIFFENLLLSIKKNHLEKYSIIVYGFINHYILDTIIHPFINYNVKYLNIPHTKIEFMLDSYLYKNNNKDKWTGKIYNILIPKLHFDTDLKLLLDDVFIKTYNEKNISKKFNISHNNSYYLYRYFINDPKLHKSKLYKLFDLFSKDKISKLTFSFQDFDTRVLNSNNLEWHNPKSDKETYNYSFNELYNIALELAIKFNHIVYNIIYNNTDLNELLKLINNLNLQNIQLLLQ